jgi:hypothetical protein
VHRKMSMRTPELPNGIIGESIVSDKGTVNSIPTRIPETSIPTGRGYLRVGQSITHAHCSIFD